MNGYERVVIDTSTLISAALRVGSLPHQAVSLALLESDVCACAETLAELDAVLMRSKFDRYATGAMRQTFADLMHKRCMMFDVSAQDMVNVVQACRDPKDTVFLALCLACEADILISSDADLLTLQPWRGIRIMTPADYLQHMDAR